MPPQGEDALSVRRHLRRAGAPSATTKPAAFHSIFARLDAQRISRRAKRFALTDGLIWTQHASGSRLALDVVDRHGAVSEQAGKKFDGIALGARRRPTFSGQVRELSRKLSARRSEN